MAQVLAFERILGTVLDEDTQGGAKVPEAAMGLRARRRNVVVWRSSADLTGRHRITMFPRLARAGRMRRLARTGGLLTVIGLTRLARALRLRWGFVLAGGVLTVAGVLLRNGAGGLLLLPGLLFLYAALLVGASPEADRKRRCELERELASYSTPAQRCDLEATLDRYPDGDTYELRDILARQAAAARHTGIPGVGRY